MNQRISKLPARPWIAVFVLAWLAAAPLAAQPTVPLGGSRGDFTVPEPLSPWVPWVLAGHPDLDCPLLGARRLCAWPGRLALDLDDRGGTFALEVTVDREMDLALPGDPTHWPRDVRRDGAPAFLRRLGERPAAGLAAGRHRLAGRFRWSRLPESLPVPPAIALVDLTIRGEAVRRPRREADGLLWLAASRGDEAEEDRLELAVFRRVEDGVPVTLLTRLRLDVAGRSRAVELGAPLPAGFVLTGLAGDLPLRWSDGERLVVQVRPGTWEVTVAARGTAPIPRLENEERPAPWPGEELWSFRADPAVRAVRVSGAAAVDPQRTSLPDEWKSLPAFRLARGDGLDFDELRRGEPQPPPDALSVHRTFWLAQDGGSFSVADALRGELFQGGRLEALAPGELGRFGYGGAAELGDQQLITLTGEGRRGVEVRKGALGASADLTYPRGGALPAVGWDRDVQSLSAELRLPPGWTLLAATGVDKADDSWIDRWTLLHFFLLLILGLATVKLDGWRWGALALAFLAVALHEPHGGGLWVWWLLLLPLRALLRVLKEGRGARLVRTLRWLALFGLAVQLVVFCADQWRTGLFPQLEETGRYSYSTVSPASLEEAFEPDVEAVPEAPAPRRRQAKDLSQIFEREEPAAEEIVQTGPGMPSWSWRSVSLTWNGPVTAGQEMRFWLISPAVELLLSLLRIAGAVALGFWLIDPRRTPGAAGPSTEGTAAAVAALVLLAVLVPGVPASAEEPPAPSPDLLAELERRLTAPPACHPDCVEVPRLAIEARGGTLSLTADVHAAARTAWPLPGPAANWTPSQVTVDGARTAALRLDGNGFFLLRLEPGVHRVELRGAARSSFALELALKPRTLSFQGAGWTLDGWRPDEPPPAAVRLERELTEDVTSLLEDDSIEPEPWLELRRLLRIGPRWRVASELVRQGASSGAVTVRVPLLAGEAVTTAGIPVESGEAVVRLEPGETVRRFASTLREAPSVELTAPSERPWVERWELSCSPIWHCAAEGLAPTRHMAAGEWRPLWQPWPGETLTLRFTRPEPAPGRTTTIDSARLELNPGRRLLEATLQLALRSSRGGEQTIVLPPEADLQSFRVDGRSQPVQDAGGRLVFTLEPGAHRLEASWRQEHDAAPFERMPRILLGGEAVDVDVTVHVPEKRWLLWAGGPGWGPVVQFWQYLLVLAVAAWALGRFTPTPLRIYDWFLLGAGLTQVPLVAALFVVLWLLSLGWRERLRPRRWWSYDGWQLVLVGLVAVGLVMLCAAIYAGLLVQPDMQVLGPGSSGSTLHWYVDRTADALPQPWILWLPLWVWKVLMLLWSLWLAARLLKWLPWTWQRLTVGPLLVTPRTFARWRDATSGSPE